MRPGDAPRGEQQRSAEESRQQADELRVEMLRLQLELEHFKKWYSGPQADRLRSSGHVAQMLLAFAEELDRKPVRSGRSPGRGQTRRGTTARAASQRPAHVADFNNLPVTTHVRELSPGRARLPVLRGPARIDDVVRRLQGLPEASLDRFREWESQPPALRPAAGKAGFRSPARVRRGPRHSAKAATAAAPSPWRRRFRASTRRNVGRALAKVRRGDTYA